MSGKRSKYSTRQAQAVTFLLTGDTVSAAAAKTGVSERQLYRWLNSPDFIDELRRQEQQVLEGVGWQLVSMSRQALDALRDVLERPEGRGQNTRRLAAKDVLELLLKWRDVVVFEERLQAIEKAVFHE